MLTSRLSALARRLRWRAGWRGASSGLTAGLAAAVLVMAAAKLAGPASFLYVGLAIVGFGLLAGAIAGLWRPVPLRSAAIQADQAAGTHELIATALEAGHSNRFTEEIVRKAEAELVARPLSTLMPARPRALPLLSLALAAAIAALPFIPSLSWTKTAADDPAVLSPQLLRALERTAREIKRVGDQNGQRDLAQLGQEIHKLAQAAQLGEMTKKEAMSKIAELTRRADEAKREQDEKNRALDALKKSPARDLADAISKGDAAEAREKAKEAAERLASGTMSDQEKKDLAESLKQIAKDSKGDLSKAAGGAAEALEKGDSDGMNDKLSKMSDKMKGAKSKGQKGQKGQKGPKEGGEQADKAEQDGDSDDLDDAQDELADAQKDLSGGGQSQKSGKYCDNCGKNQKKEKSEGG